MPTSSGIGGKPQSLGDATRRAADTPTKRGDAHDMLSVPCLLAVKVNSVARATATPSRTRHWRCYLAALTRRKPR